MNCFFKTTHRPNNKVRVAVTISGKGEHSTVANVYLSAESGTEEEARTSLGALLFATGHLLMGHAHTIAPELADDFLDAEDGEEESIEETSQCDEDAPGTELSESSSPDAP